MSTLIFDYNRIERLEKMFHVLSNPARDICKSNQPAGSTALIQFEHANQLLMSVGGADHRIPQCNHLTLFGSAVSVVEFPPHRKFLCWMLQKFLVRRSCFTVCRHFLLCIARFESIA